MARDAMKAAARVKQILEPYSDDAKKLIMQVVKGEQPVAKKYGKKTEKAAGKKKVAAKAKKTKPAAEEAAEEGASEE